MNRPFPSFGMILTLGLGWSLVLYMSLCLVPFSGSADQVYGDAVILTAAVLNLLTAVKQRRRWPTLVFAMIVLMLFATAAADATTKILGAAAVAGWIRNSGLSSLKQTASQIAELVSATATIGLAVSFHPSGPMVIGLCIWFFYLLQIVPLAVSDHSENVPGMEELRSRFERTRHKVEKILAVRI